MSTLRLPLTVAIYLLVTPSAVHASLISFEKPLFQSEKQISSYWQTIPESKRELIQSYLLRLGLSSTGVIYLTGVYSIEGRTSLIQFQQLDLHGTRLFWSVLINPKEMTARIIYDIDQDKISSGFVPLPEKK